MGTGRRTLISILVCVSFLLVGPLFAEEGYDGARCITQGCQCEEPCPKPKPPDPGYTPCAKACNMAVNACLDEASAKLKRYQAEQKKKRGDELAAAKRLEEDRKERIL